MLGGRHKSFFTEHRKFTVEKISKKEVPTCKSYLSSMIGEARAELTSKAL